MWTLPVGIDTKCTADKSNSDCNDTICWITASLDNPFFNMHFYSDYIRSVPCSQGLSNVLLKVICWRSMSSYCILLDDDVNFFHIMRSPPTTKAQLNGLKYFCFQVTALPTMILVNLAQQIPNRQPSANSNGRPFTTSRTRPSRRCSMPRRQGAGLLATTRSKWWPLKRLGRPHHQPKKRLWWGPASSKPARTWTPSITTTAAGRQRSKS